MGKTWSRKKQIFCLIWNLISRSIPIWWTQWWCLVLDWKYCFWANLVHIFKFCFLRWNCWMWIMRICGIRWCSFFSVLDQNFFFFFFCKNLVPYIKIYKFFLKSFNLIVSGFCFDKLIQIQTNASPLQSFMLMSNTE